MRRLPNGYYVREPGARYNIFNRPYRVCDARHCRNKMESLADFESQSYAMKNMVQNSSERNGAYLIFRVSPCIVAFSPAITLDSVRSSVS